MSTPYPSSLSSRLIRPAHWARAELTGYIADKRSVSSNRNNLLAVPALLSAGLIALACPALAQTTIFSENLGTPTASPTSIAAYSTGTAPATFENKGTLTYGSGDAASPADLRATSTSNYAGASGGGNVWFTSTPGSYGFSIESINASAYGDLKLSYAYRKDLASALPTLSVDYWNGAAWVAVANTPGDLFIEAATDTTGWKVAKTLTLPAGAQIADLKIRFVKSGNNSLRIDDIKLTGSPVGGDTTAPVISTLSPANGATTADIYGNLTASFSEAITVGTGNIIITKTADPGVSFTIPITDPQVLVSGSTLTINPTADLDYSTAYHVKIAPGAVKDNANNNFAGISDTTTWAFTTAAMDVTAPAIISVTPADDSTGIAPPATLTITFDELVQLPAFGGPMIMVYKSDGTPVAAFDAVFGGGISVAGTVATVTIPSSTPLDYDTSYFVEIDDGVFEDLSGNPAVGITGTTAWNFTTASLPVLTNVAYTQDFSGFTAVAPYPAVTTLLPPGWSVNGPDLSYDGDFGTSALGGFRGNASVLGYQHTNNTGVLTETLTLRNGTGVVITDLIVSYKGRSNGPGTGRDPAFIVSINGTVVPDLGYSTSSGDGVIRSASIGSLSIPANATFQLSWSSDGPNAPGSNSRRQIGISEVSVASGVAVFPPSLAATSVDYNTLTSTGVEASGNITGDGGSAITQRGFVYSATSVNAAPEIGATGVTTLIDGATTTGPLAASLSSLTPATQYSVRAYAKNAQGTSYSSTLVVHTLATPPTFVNSYSQPFAGFVGSIVTGTLPPGWTVLSEFGLNGYSGTWAPVTSSAGLLGNVSEPAGVLGYQHTSGSGIVTKKLTLINGTGATLDQLYISYLGRVNRTTEGRSPAYVVSVNGAETPALAYTTAGNVDLQPVSTTLTGLGIAPGASFTVTWVSTRGTGSDASKQIGIANVLIATSAPAGYSGWNGVNAGGQGPALDYDGDGVKNGVEYFFGATGSTFTANPQPVNGVVSFPYAGAPGATYKVWTSTNLTSWTDVTSSTTIQGGFLKYTLPVGEKVFVRLEVNVAP